MNPSNEQILRDALQTAEMAMLGYTVRNDVISKALKDARAALAATTPESAPADAPGDLSPTLTQYLDAAIEHIEASRGDRAIRCITAAIKSHPAPSQSADQVRDAARYRWLIQLFGVTKLPCFLESELGHGYIADGKESIDKSIDAAILATSSAAKGDQA